MKIDFHTHIWEPEVADADRFVAELDELGIDKAVVMPIAPNGTNEGAARCASRFPDRIIGFASVVPSVIGMRHNQAVDPVKILEHAVNDLGLRGVKLHPILQGFSIDDVSAQEVVRAAGELGVPVLIHTGPAFPRRGRIRNADIRMIDDLAMSCPDTTIIAGHGEPLIDGPYIARKHPNVYLETAVTWSRMWRLMPNIISEAVKLCGADKILFGTDFSIGGHGLVRDMIEAFDGSGLSSDDLQSIYWKNAAGILGLDAS